MRYFVHAIALSLLLAACGGGPNEFRSGWPADLDRPWAGPDYWANPLQDWRVRGGRLENVQAGGDRNVFLLTREISERPGRLDLEVRLGLLEPAEDPGAGFAGFRVGIQGAFNDYRDSAVRGWGVNAGVATDGRLFIGEAAADAPRWEGPLDDVALRLTADPVGAAYRLTLTAEGSGDEATVVRELPAERLVGGVALVSHSGEIPPMPPSAQEIRETGWEGKPNTERGGSARFWFEDWTVSGDKLDAHPERKLGPIVFAMHTLSKGVLKLTAQLAPIDGGPNQARLEIEDAGAWKTIAEADIEPDSRTATFRVEGWDSTRDRPYRVVYESDVFDGTIRKDPVDKAEIVVAAFTGNNDLGFPHADVVQHVKAHDPDFLAFTGDSIYERVGEYGIQREPTDMAILDYLRKWYIYGWEYRDLLREIPAVAIPDDHDVYQGNIWGAGGRHAEPYGKPGQDKGGYTMDARFVKVVERTQTSNLPDPYDPTPVERGIGVYYTDVLYGGVSFAVIEDRKWKSAPAVVLPKAEIVNGWAQNSRYDAARDGNVPGATLLGERQLKFLEEWAADWSGGAWMKAVISQTIFADVATLPKGTTSDDVTPRLQVMPPGEYAKGEEPVQDHDSNGWPQTPRNEALRRMRAAFAFHIAGDQHLGSTIQYGIDRWNDAGWALCVPSVANIWPRRWYPPKPGRNRKPDSPAYTGEYLDGFGNKMTVWAVSNPTANGVEPTAIHHRAPGYGIVKFNRETRKISIANWPRSVDPKAPNAVPYEGWPIEIDQLDNGFPHAGRALEPITADRDDPVVQVVDRKTGKPVYTVRVQGREFTPRVWKAGDYEVKVSP